MREKINCLEGIRTIGCISVFLCHFRGAFLPDQAIWLIDHTPLMILTAGNSVVRILFVVSGFVISYKYFEIQRYEQVPKDMLKRYFRLAPSVIAANLFVYFLMKFGFMFHVQAAAVSGSEDFLGIFNNFTPNLVQCLKEALITCYFQGANGYIGPLWTMVYEYLGAILVLCVIYVCKGSYLRYLFYIVMFICFSSYYNYFVLGMLICDIYVQQDMNEILQRHRWISYGLFLPGGGYLVCMYQINDAVKITRVIYAAGLVMLFLGLLNCKYAEKLLGNSLMCQGGKLSYAVYILHWPVIESFSSAYYLWMRKSGADCRWTIFSCFGLTVILVWLMAYFFNRYVENIGHGAISYIENKLYI